MDDLIKIGISSKVWCTCPDATLFNVHQLYYII